MGKLPFALVLVVLVLGYSQARPYYYGYHYVPWYPVSPCNLYPPPPCSSYPYSCGELRAPPSRPTPCNPQPSGPPKQPPPAYNQQVAEEALLTQDINEVRRVRQGILGPRPPRGQLPQRPREYSKYPQYNTNEYRALKRKPNRRNRIGNRRKYDEGEHYGGYGRGMAPAGYRDQAEDADDYEDDDDEEYDEYDRGMGQARYRDEGDYGNDEDDHGMGQGVYRDEGDYRNDEDDEDDY